MAISYEELAKEVNQNPDWFMVSKSDLDATMVETARHWTGIAGHEEEEGIAMMIAFIHNMKIRRKCGKPDHDERDLVGIEDIGDD